MVASRHATPRGCRVLLGLAVLWGIALLSEGRSGALDHETTRATLRSIEGVQVIVEQVPPEVERAGLTTQQLQADVESRLRHAGIRIHTTKEEKYSTPGAPCLYIHVTVMLESNGLAVCAIHVEFKQKAALEIDGSLADVATWSVGPYLGSGSRSHLAAIRDTVKDSVDRFINAYVSVHPPPSP